VENEIHEQVAAVVIPIPKTTLPGVAPDEAAAYPHPAGGTKMPSGAQPTRKVKGGDELLQWGGEAMLASQ
jgi:hypothetical protein